MAVLVREIQSGRGLYFFPEWNNDVMPEHERQLCIIEVRATTSPPAEIADLLGAVVEAADQAWMLDGNRSTRLW